MEVATANAILKSKDGIVRNMQLVLHCLQGEVALHKIEGFYEQIDFYAPGSIPAKHRASFSVYEIMRAMNRAIEEEDMEKLRKCKAFTLHIDESTDQYISHKLIVYVNFVSEGLEKKELFCKLIELQELDATSITNKLVEYFQRNQIDLQKMVMFTSDGASVMLGKRNGVAAQLRGTHGISHLISFHCVCHREALAMTDALKACPSFQEMQTAIASLIRFISHNANLMGMQRLAHAFGTVYIKLEQVYEIRWLSIASSVLSVCRSYETILLQLEEAAARRDAEAQGQLKRCQNEEFVTKLFNLNDVLQILDKLCSKLQYDDIHPFDSNRYVKDAIDELKANYLLHDDRVTMSSATQNAMAKYLKHADRQTTKDRIDTGINEIKGLVKILVKILKKRLASDDQILEAAKVFEFSDGAFGDGYAEYGIESLRTLFIHFRSMLPDDVDENNILGEWDGFKYGDRQLKHAIRKKYNWRRTMQLLFDHADSYPNLVLLGSIVSAFSPQNAIAERGFSLTNRLRTKLRNRLTVDTTDTLMRLKLHQTKSQHYDYVRAAGYWHAAKQRYGVGEKVSRKRKKNAVVPNQEAGTHSEGDFEGFTPEESLRYELANYVKYGWDA